MAHKRKVVQEIDKLVAERKKKYVRVDEGAALYSMGTHSFRELARDAKAVVKVKGILLINTDIFDDYLELFREEV